MSTNQPSNSTPVAIIRDWTNFSLGGAENLGRGASDQVSAHSRQDILALANSPDPRSVQTIYAILASELSENNRESALKVLGAYGGEQVITLLETVYYGRERAKFGKGAAKNALKALGLCRDDEPLMDPNRLSDTFIGLGTVRDAERPPRRPDANFAEVVNYGMLDIVIPWSPTDAGMVRVDIAERFDVEAAARQASKAGLEVDKIGSNAIIVSGTAWPGFKLSSPPLKITFFVEDSSKRSPHLKIICDRIPSDTGVQGWQSATRLLVRLGRWLGG